MTYPRWSKPQSPEDRDPVRRGWLEGSGTVELRDGTDIDWYLWTGKRPMVQSYGAIGGYIAVLYRGELYDRHDHMALYRSFGITHGAVHHNLWLIIRPQEDSGAGYGVYPRSDRSSLQMRVVGALPIHDWAAEFAHQLPDPILAAISAAQGAAGGSLDDSWKQRLVARFGDRWKVFRRVPSRNGDVTTTRDGTGARRRVRPPHPHPGPAQKARPHVSPIPDMTVKKLETGPDEPGTQAAERVQSGNVPDWEDRPGSDFERGILAVYSSNDPKHPNGVVLINRDHPVLVQQIQTFQERYPPQHETEIAHAVLTVYGEIGVSKVAHSEHMRKLMPNVEALRSNEAMTMSLLGLMAEESLIQTRLGGRFGRGGQR